LIETLEARVRALRRHNSQRSNDNHTMRVHIKPRLQVDKWSLYWKTSMVTKTFALDEFDLDVPRETTAKQLKAQV